MKQIIFIILCANFALNCAGLRNGRLTMPEQQAIANIKEYEKQAQAKPDHIESLFRLAQAHDAIGQKALALEELARIIALDRNFADAYLLTAKIYHSEKQPAKALATYLQVLDLPHGHNYYQHIAQAVGMPYTISAVQVGAGNNAMARYSPDGKQIAWQSDRDGDWNIYLAKANGTGVRAVVFDSGNDEHPVFSPNGQFLAFVSSRHDLQPHAMGEEKREIYLYDLMFRKQIRITENDIDDWAPVFYPDSSRLLYVSEENSIQSRRFFDRTSTLFHINVDGSEKQAFAESKLEQTSPAPLPDGRLAWVAFDGKMYHIVAAKAGALPDTLLSGAYPKSGLCASPTGEYLTFFSNKDDNVDIYLLNLYNNRLSRITASHSKDIYPAFSPDGERIIFSSDRLGSYSLFTIDLTAPVVQDELRAKIELLLTNLESPANSE